LRFLFYLSLNLWKHDKDRCILRFKWWRSHVCVRNEYILFVLKNLVLLLC
jgi:hypothetical protein